jgi:hypothetical protein
LKNPESLAKAIITISDAMEALLKSGLNRRAIAVLLSDSTNIPITKIFAVLDGLAALKKDYCS